MILIGLGANLPSRFGGPEATLAAACDALERRGVRIVRTSPVYRSAPVPVSDQPWYCNAVAAVETEMEPPALLQLLHDIENDFGRVRAARNEARLLDLDLLAYGDRIIEEGMTLPHPRLQGRAFVLLPLRDIAPGWVHPQTGETVAALAGALPPGQAIEQGGDLR